MCCLETTRYLFGLLEIEETGWSEECKSSGRHCYNWGFISIFFVNLGGERSIEKGKRMEGEVIGLWKPMIVAAWNSGHAIVRLCEIWESRGGGGRERFYIFVGSKLAEGRCIGNWGTLFFSWGIWLWPLMCPIHLYQFSKDGSNFSWSPSRGGTGHISGQAGREKWGIRLNRVGHGIVLYLYYNIILLNVFFNSIRWDSKI